MVHDPQEKRPTIYDLARDAQTSPSTVSAVLNGSWRKRRISEAVATRVQSLARDRGYTINMQARALRNERSGILGMIVPMYDNRYFSSIAQTFEAEARRRGLFGIVSCTNRDPAQELEAAERMISHRVEKLICCGATDPDGLAELCARHGVGTVNLDLPGTRAPSVISDNADGARRLTHHILDQMPPDAARQPLFIGGRESDHNTRERIRGYREALAERGIEAKAEMILPCGYAAAKARASFAGFVSGTGAVPPGLFVNSTISFEGITQWFVDGGRSLEDTFIGCFDWDPFAAVFSRRLSMIRQDVPEMIARLFAVIEAEETSGQYQIAPHLIARRG